MIQRHAPIGVFDSGYGGLTILKEIRKCLPDYDYIYLGDNARAPYGSRSFEVVYDFTLQAVRYLFEQGCRLVILACNTASAKALRTIQQNDLPSIDPNRRVLGIIRPTVEILADVTRTGHIGILGTSGTVDSMSYPMEISKLHPEFKVVQQACPMWVPLVENHEADKPGADYFIDRYLDSLKSKDREIDTVILACTHYPIMLPKIRGKLDKKINIISQGQIVAESLADYLHRHPEIESCCSKNASCRFLTTENPEKFERLTAIFLDEPVDARRIELPGKH